jgi:hypothetical protein
MKYFCFVSFAVGVLLMACEKRSSAEVREARLRMKERCAQAGIKVQQEWHNRYQGETFSDQPEYGYNERLNTCLYADEYWDSGTPMVGGASRHDRFVLDVFANRILAEYTEHDGRSITAAADPVMCRTEEEFAARKAQLFAQAPPSTMP